MEPVELHSTKLLKKLLGEYFTKLGNPETKVAWCTSVGPAELLRAMGYEVYFPENHGALLGSLRTACELIPTAVKAGYAGDVCSYTTSDIGAYLSNQTPLARYGLKSIPKPDVIVYCTNQCREVQDWFTFYAREFGCPILGVHTARHIDTLSSSMIAQTVDEYKTIADVCSAASNQKFDLESFAETVRLSREATTLWQQCLQTAKSTPAPWTFFDGCIHMAPIVVLRGTHEALYYYGELLSELQQIQSANLVKASQERCRLFWDGMPVWGKLRMLSELCLEHNTSVVASTYCNSWVFDLFDEQRPFESTAAAYLSIFINRSENVKQQYLERMIDDYNVDGIIFHDAKTCFNNSNVRFGLPQRLKQSTGVPVLVVEGDLCDLRFFSEGQTITRIETFIEQIESLQRHEVQGALSHT